GWRASAGRGQIGPREVVVDDSGGVAITTFKTSAHRTHPGHVQGRGQYTEVVESRVRNNEHQIARQRIGVHESNGDVVPPLGGDFWNQQVGRSRHIFDVKTRRGVGKL